MVALDLTSMLTLFVLGYLTARVNIVYEARIGVLNDAKFPVKDRLERYERLPSYLTMAFLQPFTWSWRVEG
jgi:hypothetical protein